ncbi:MAG: hypothetical protein QM773_18370 [Hyphomonadaceae bacterium]
MSTLIALLVAFMVLQLLVNGAYLPDPDLPGIWVSLSPGEVAPDRQFLLGNTLFNLLGHGLTGLSGGQKLSEQSYLAFSYVMVFICVFVMLIVSTSRLGVSRASIFLGVVGLSMLDFNLFHWLGKTDPLVITTYTVVFFLRRNPAPTAIGFAVIGGLHAEQAIVIAAVHAIILVLERSMRLSVLVALVSGIAAGLAGNQLYVNAFGLTGSHDRIALAVSNGGDVLTTSIKYFLRNIGVASVSVLFGVWWLALRTMAESRRTFLLLAAALCIATGVAACTLDYSRVAGLLAMPVTFFLAEQMAMRWRDEDRLPFSTAVLLGGVALVGVELSGGQTIGADERPFI